MNLKLFIFSLFVFGAAYADESKSTHLQDAAKKVTEGLAIGTGAMSAHSLKKELTPFLQDKKTWKQSVQNGLELNKEVEAHMAKIKSGGFGATSSFYQVTPEEAGEIFRDVRVKSRQEVLRLAEERMKDLNSYAQVSKQDLARYQTKLGNDPHAWRAEGLRLLNEKPGTLVNGKVVTAADYQKKAKLAAALSEGKIITAKEYKERLKGLGKYIADTKAKLVLEAPKPTLKVNLGTVFKGLGVGAGLVGTGLVIKDFYDLSQQYRYDPTRLAPPAFDKKFYSKADDSDFDAEAVEEAKRAHKRGEYDRYVE